MLKIMNWDKNFKKVLFVLAISFTLLLTGCKEKGYDNPEELVQKYMDTVVKILNGEDVDIDVTEFCTEISKGDFYYTCKRALKTDDEAYETDKLNTLEFTISSSEITELSETEKISYDLTEYDVVYKYPVEISFDMIGEKGETLYSEVGESIILLIKEEGLYYIIDILS